MFGAMRRRWKGTSAYNVLHRELLLDFGNKTDVINTLAGVAGLMPELNKTELALYFLLDTNTGEIGEGVAQVGGEIKRERLEFLNKLDHDLHLMLEAERISKDFFDRWSPILDAEINGVYGRRLSDA